MTVGTGTVVTVNRSTKTDLINNGTVKKVENADVAPFAGYHWNEDNTQSAHNRTEKKENEVIGDLNNYGSYDKVIFCSVCGHEHSRKVVSTGKVGVAEAEIDGFLYETLEEAIEAAVAADETKTVKLKKKLVKADAIEIASGKVIIDLNGFFIEVSNHKAGAALIVGKDATVELTNLATGTDSYIGVDYNKYTFFDCIVKNNGILTISNIRLNGANLFKSGAATIVNAENATLTLNAGTKVTVNRSTKTGLINNGTFSKADDVIL